MMMLTKISNSRIGKSKATQVEMTIKRTSARKSMTQNGTTRIPNNKKLKMNLDTTTGTDSIAETTTKTEVRTEMIS